MYCNHKNYIQLSLPPLFGSTCKIMSILFNYLYVVFIIACFLTNTPIIFSLHHHLSCHNIHIDCNCNSEVIKFIIFNVIWVMLPITIIIFDGD